MRKIYTFDFIFKKILVISEIKKMQTKTSEMYNLKYSCIFTFIKVKQITCRKFFFVQFKLLFFKAKNELILPQKMQRLVTKNKTNYEIK